MDANLKVPKSRKILNVLLVGNSPAEMEIILNKLNQVRTTKIITEIAFDLKTTMDRLRYFEAGYIFIDDNVGKEELTQTVTWLNANRKTKQIPVTVIKNTNYNESAISPAILDYLMKKDISGESLLKSVGNSLKAKRTQLYLGNTYQKRKRKFLRLVGR